LTISQRIRKRIEEVFGWTKSAAGMRQTKFRGAERVGWAFNLAAAAYNLVRLPRLLAQTAYGVETLAAADAVLVIDETGFLKQGKAPCGVNRQYTGSAGKITNCHIGVFAAYVSRHGHAFIDRALYLPKTWTDDGSNPPTRERHAARKNDPQDQQTKDRTRSRALIRWSRQDIRRIAVRLAQRRIEPAHIIAWSLWRRAATACATRHRSTARPGAPGRSPPGPTGSGTAEGRRRGHE
jgi:hypothetical protein